MSLQDIKRALIGYVGSRPSGDNTDPKGFVEQFSQDVIVMRVTDGGTAGTAAAEAAAGYVPHISRVRSIYLTTPVGVTADNTNNAVFTVGKRTAGGSRTTIGTLTTNVAQGNITALSPVALTLTAANVNLAVGDAITVELTKGASGVAIASATGQATISVVVEKGTA